MMRTMLALIVMLSGCGDPQLGNPTDATSNADGSSPSDGGGTDGGGDGSDSPAWYKSGTRIKMVVLNTPDGAKQFNGWHDSSRNEDCTFVATSDGMTRCLPTRDAAPIYSYAASYFADAGCTVPVAQVSTSCATLPTYILTIGLNSCQNSLVYTAVNLRGSQMYTSAYVKSGASCTSVIANASVVYYGLGASVAPTEFQTATRAVE